MDKAEIKSILEDKGLRITPQRLAVFEAIDNMKEHPSADRIIDFIKKNYPYIAPGTVYKILDIFTENGILERVKTEKDIMRYDMITSTHHHLYCSETERIEDYFDENLNQLLDDYFRNASIPGFAIRDVRLQINGKFTNPKK